MTDRRAELRAHFLEQALFAEGYSPLYARLFGVMAEWLAATRADPLIDWLLDVSVERRLFDVTLLLPAALHRDVLAGVPEAGELAQFYPSAGGRVPEPGDKRFAHILRSTIGSRRDTFAAFIRRAGVQTNETARGLAWLLPVACLGWPAVHLLELGASAGLNLVAERRAYRLESDENQPWLELGRGVPPQFVTRSRNRIALPQLPCCPAILSRTGGDLRPFFLRTPDDEQALAAFVWADQVERLARLREGIAALRAVEYTAAPVRLFPLHLPAELPDFLDRHASQPLDAPLVIFNTTVGMYLPARGAALGEAISNWAATQPVPVLWLQWESPMDNTARPPDRSWLAWTADLWRGGVHHRFQLAWIHPHGTALEWHPEAAEFLSITRQT